MQREIGPCQLFGLFLQFFHADTGIILCFAKLFQHVLCPLYLLMQGQKRLALLVGLPTHGVDLFLCLLDGVFQFLEALPLWVAQYLVEFLRCQVCAFDLAFYHFQILVHLLQFGGTIACLLESPAVVRQQFLGPLQVCNSSREGLLAYLLGIAHGILHGEVFARDALHLLAHSVDGCSVFLPFFCIHTVLLCLCQCGFESVQFWQCHLVYALAE